MHGKGQKDRKGLRFEDIEPLLDGVKCVGFDVFDTLLLRPFMKPADLFRHMEESTSSPGFAAERINAERRARTEIRKEINIDEIYSLIDKRFQDLKEKELETEYKLSLADPGIKEIYDRISGLGIEIIAVSDMYLPGDSISGMLEKNGYFGLKKVYVSNEYGVSKRTGELFKKVLDDLNTEAGEMLFIGDNLRSDHRVPLSLGVRSVKYVPSKERYARSHKREMRFSRNAGLGGSVIAAMDMLRWLRNSSEEDYWYDIAYRFGGPIASFFTLFLMSKITDTTGSIFFISRDGYNLQKIYNTISDEPVENNYIYASRLFTIIFGRDLPESKDGARYLFERFSDVDEVKAIDIPKDPTDKDYFIRLNENPDLFKGLLEREHSRYSEYLKDKAGKGDILLVDVTTRKYSSQKFVQSVVGPERHTVGCYYNLMAHDDMVYSAYADRSRSRICWNKINVSEFFLGSPEGPVDNITADGIPVFQNNIDEPELFRMSIYDRITKGELDYAEDLKAVFGHEMPMIGHKVLDKWIKVLVRDKSSADPEHIRKIQWAQDKGHTLYLGVVFGPKEAVYKLRSMVGDFLWKIWHR